MKNQRHFFIGDVELKKLQDKAREHFEGHGYLSKYIRKIANAKCVLIIEGSEKFKISVD